MLRKLLLVLVLFNSFVQADNPSPTIESIELSASSVSIKGIHSKQQANPKDWIAIYEVGTSNDWENVIQWAWVRDLAFFDNSAYWDSNTIRTKGTYEVRYFLNNSYTTHKKSNSFFVSGPHILEKRAGIDGNPQLLISYTSKNKLGKDWIAIYKKGTSTAWENVIHWSWVKDLTCSVPAECHNEWARQALAPGNYEFRYFSDNSYNIDDSMEFQIKAVPSNLEGLYLYTKSMVSLQGLGKNIQPNPKDWVAIYEVGSSNDWENVIQWIWAKDVDLTVNRSNDAYWRFNKIKKAGKYEVRYFLNNTFTTHKKSRAFTIK